MEAKADGNTSLASAFNALSWELCECRICEAREESVITTTKQLAKLISRRAPSKKTVKKNIHPATRVFQVKTPSKEPTLNLISRQSELQ